MDLKRRIRRIIALLSAEYGIPCRRPSRDLLGSLISTMLSQNTTSANTRVAFERLKAKFPHWEDLASAPVRSIASAIRPAGLAAQRAPRIKGIIQRLLDQRGTASLEFLKKRTNEQIVSYLISFPGVGAKTAACLLLFDMGRRAFPVDTHVARSARRLAVVDEAASVGVIQAVMEEVFPPTKFLSLHLNLVKHGRQVCKARSPQCPSCVLAQLCPSAALATQERAKLVKNKRN